MFLKLNPAFDRRTNRNETSNDETCIDHANSHANVGWSSREKWRFLRNQCVVTVSRIVAIIRDHYGGRWSQSTLDHANDSTRATRAWPRFKFKFKIRARFTGNSYVLDRRCLMRIYGNDPGIVRERTTGRVSGNVIGEAGKSGKRHVASMPHESDLSVFDVSIEFFAR